MSALHHHNHADAHGHTHGVTDPLLLASEKGVRAVKWSLGVLLATAVAQSVIVVLSGSAALLADTLHNFADAITAVPLWMAFRLARWRPTGRFTYGYGRLEDLAGAFIVMMIFASGVAVGYESLSRLWDPQPVNYLGIVAGAGFVGFLGNEAVARLRMKVGHEIGSAALVADGHHARADALTSLAVIIAAGGVWLGFPLADPVVGLVVTLIIFHIAFVSGKCVVLRLLDAVDPEVVGEIQQSARKTPGVADVTEARVRWLGHRLHAELNVSVEPGLSVEQGHDVAVAVRHTLLHQLRYLSNATIHIDPLTASGEAHHHIANHTHDEFPTHSH